MKIVRAIVAGEREPKVLAQYRDPNCKNSEEVIAKSLEGNYSSEHLFVLQQALELYDIYTAKIRTCDAEVEKLYSTFEPQVDLVEEPLKPSKKNRRKNKNVPEYDLRTYLYQMTGVDLTAIDGLDVADGADHNLRGWHRYEQMEKREAFHFMVGVGTGERYFRREGLTQRH